MQLVLAAARAVFVHFQAVRVVAAILNRGVIPLLALCAGEINHWADIFFLRSHFYLTWLPFGGSHVSSILKSYY
jgi:tryptophan-rich sensory protein